MLWVPPSGLLAVVKGARRTLGSALLLSVVFTPACATRGSGSPSTAPGPLDGTYVHDRNRGSGTLVGPVPPCASAAFGQGLTVRGQRAEFLLGVQPEGAPRVPEAVSGTIAADGTVAIQTGQVRLEGSFSDLPSAIGTITRKTFTGSLSIVAPGGGICQYSLLMVRP
jgi:hypothetical protein